jgi:hypothetical protein
MTDARHPAQRAQLFPVRHHSPRAAVCLERLLDHERPALLLIEGPSDANGLIDVLTDSGSTPPVAILAYRTDAEPDSVVWPFARYSPEFVALQWARANGVPARFIDQPAGVVLAEQQRARAQPPSALAAEAAEPAREVQAPFGERLAQHFGLRHFDEFWDSFFETPDYDSATYRVALDAYAEALIAAHAIDEGPRDALMAAAIAEAAHTVTPEQIVVVLGAAHAAALNRGRFAPTAPPSIDALPCALTLIPYSYPRLSERSGYGAGNRAPWYYERAYGSDLDYGQASLRVLLEFSSSLKLRGFVVSLADVLEAWRLCRQLSMLRGKSAPGLDELADAARAAMTRGEQAPIAEFLEPLLIGQRIGQVSARQGLNALQQEFNDALTRFKLPRIDASETLSLRLNDPLHAQASEFLHRLRVADIPYAGYAGSQAIASAGRIDGDEAGGFAAFSRVREHWTVQWTPATDVALHERILYGDRLEIVCERKLAERLTGAMQVARASEVLIDAVLTQARDAIARALADTERLSAADEDVLSLASGARTLVGLIAYGQSRAALNALKATVERLLLGAFARARLRIATACRGDANATAPARGAMKILNELALAQPMLEPKLWFAALHEVAADSALEPTASGCATALLALAHELDERGLAVLLDTRLGDTLTPARAADFLTGLFDVNALVLLKNPALVAALSGFLQALPIALFRDALPALRRAFSELKPSERRILLEQLVRAHSADETAAAATLKAPDAAALKSLGADLDAALDDLGDLL